MDQAKTKKIRRGNVKECVLSLFTGVSTGVSARVKNGVPKCVVITTQQARRWLVIDFYSALSLVPIPFWVIDRETSKWWKNDGTVITHNVWCISMGNYTMVTPVIWSHHVRIQTVRWYYHFLLWLKDITVSVQLEPLSTSQVTSPCLLPEKRSVFW